ncbi:hypothetical protein MJH12_19365, partial [bacterium]|nr:hypothetical protein [bacterium]
MNRIKCLFIFLFALSRFFAEQSFQKAELSIMSGSVLLKRSGITGMLRYSRNVTVYLEDDIQTSRDFRGALILEDQSRIALEWGKLYRWRKQGFFLIEKNKWLRLGELRRSDYQNKTSGEAGIIGKIYVRGKIDITRPKEFQHRRLSGEFSLVKGDLIEVLGSSQVGIEMVDGLKIDLGLNTLIEISDYGLYLRQGFVSVLAGNAQEFEVVTHEFSVMGRTDDYHYEVEKSQRTHVRNLAGVTKVFDKSSKKVEFLKPRTELTSSTGQRAFQTKVLSKSQRAHLSPEHIKDYSRKKAVIGNLSPIDQEHDRIYRDIQLQLKGQFVEKTIKKAPYEAAGRKYLRTIKASDQAEWKKRNWKLDRRQKVLPTEPNDFVI